MTFDVRAEPALVTRSLPARGMPGGLRAAALALLLLLCAACSAASSAAPGATTAGAPDADSAKVVAAKLAACLKKQGIEAEVGADGSMQVGGNPTVSPGSLAEDGPAPDTIDKAYRECTKQVTGAYPTEQPVDPAELAWQRKYAKCMRAQGIDYPDPKPDGTVAATAAVDDGKKAQAAQALCDKQVPHP